MTVDLSERIFLVLIASLPIMQPIKIDFRGYDVPPSDFIFIAAAIAAAVALVSGRKRFPASRLFWWLALYAAALSLSAFGSPNRARSLLKLAGSVYLIGLSALAMVQVQSVAALRRALSAWLVGAAATGAAALLGVVLFAGGVADARINLFLSIRGSLPSGSYPRVRGLFLNPNMFCAYLVASLAILVAVRQAGWVGRTVFVSMTMAVVVAAAFSLSPGLGGLLLVMAFFTWVRWNDRHPRIVRAVIAVSVAGAVAFLLVMMVSPPTAFAPRFRPSSRVLTWIAAAKTFRAHPWTGKGLGLDPVYVEYVNPSGTLEALTDAHNVWLSLLAQAGIVGLASFLAIVIFLLRGTRPLSLRNTRHVLQSGLTVAFVAGFLYQSVSGSFEDTRHVWVLIGLLAAVKELPDAQASIERVKPGPPAAT